MSVKKDGSTVTIKSDVQKEIRRMVREEVSKATRHIWYRIYLEEPIYATHMLALENTLVDKFSKELAEETT